MNQALESKFDLSLRDRDVCRAIRTNLQIEHRATFCADDIFLWKLDRFFSDTAHEVGGLFAKLQHSGIIVVVGRVRSMRTSNHQREIRLYSFTGEGLK